MTQNVKEELEKQFDDMHWTNKARAMGALEREDEKWERLKDIRHEVERYGDRVIEMTEFSNYVFIKYRTRLGGKTKEMYQVYINGKRCPRITNNPQILMLVALTYEHDGINTQADRLVAQMLGIEELDEEDE